MAEIANDDTLSLKLDHAIEECGEFLAAAGKTGRHGYFSYHPNDPEKKPNIDWLIAEAKDVEKTIGNLIDALEDMRG